MSKPSDIPQDVWDAAEAVGEAIHGRHERGWVSWPLITAAGPHPQEIVARAIKADRGAFKGPVHHVLAILPVGEFEVSSIAQPSGMTRKEFFNRITYLARIGQITRIGYGRYRRAP